MMGKIIEMLKPYIQADIALAYCSFIKMADLGYPMPDRVIQMWVVEIDRVRKVAKVELTTDEAIEISRALAFAFWQQIDIGEQFRLIQNAKQMLKFGRV